MADGIEIHNVVEGEPDTSDLTMVVVNVETREGRQLTFILEASEGETLGMQHYTGIAGDVRVHTFECTILGKSEGSD